MHNDYTVIEVIKVIKMKHTASVFVRFIIYIKEHKTTVWAAITLL